MVGTRLSLCTAYHPSSRQHVRQDVIEMLDTSILLRVEGGCVGHLDTHQAIHISLDRNIKPWS